MEYFKSKMIISEFLGGGLFSSLNPATSSAAPTSTTGTSLFSSLATANKPATAAATTGIEIGKL